MTDHAAIERALTCAECGQTFTVDAYRLSTAKYCSNPCRYAATLQHGGAVHTNVAPEYFAWGSIKARCFNARNHNYPGYGGRGISMCEAWRLSFPQFLADMGPRPSSRHSIDRIDNNGDYEPSNCRWSTLVEQARNRRTNRLLTLDGTTRCLTEWASIYGLRRVTLHGRLARGWTLERAVATRPRGHRRG